MQRDLIGRGRVVHRRSAPREHSFEYPVWMVYTRVHPDPAALVGVPSVLASIKHLPEPPLLIERLKELEIPPRDLQIYALTQPSAFGYSFNPVSFYFCFVRSDLVALLLEVTNTPWGEVHWYGLRTEGQGGTPGRFSFEFDKALHVSPFLTMEGSYSLTLDFDEEHIRIGMAFCEDPSQLVAGLTLRMQALRPALLLRLALRQPAQNLLTQARIHYQAARLWLKRTPFHAHPNAKTNTPSLSGTSLPMIESGPGMPRPYGGDCTCRGRACPDRNRGSQSHVAAFKGGKLATTLERRVRKALATLRGGTLEIICRDQAIDYGKGAPRIRLQVLDPDFFRQIVFGGSTGAGDAYVKGAWNCDDLVGLVRLMSRNRSLIGGFESPLSFPLALADRIRYSFQRNDHAGSRKNISSHYDLGNEFFETFLDRRMMYSSAVFKCDDESLDNASERKIRQICQKLGLGPDDHLLEIGTGWGGLAVFAAQHFGCRVTTATISTAQYEYAKARVEDLGLESKIQVLLSDYRDLQGRFDKLVAVEMVEAVGAEYLQGFFEKCASLLSPEGLMVMQAIVIRDSRYLEALKRVDFMKKHIFPGGFLPSVSLLTLAAAKADLSLVNLEDFAKDYALTLRAWRAGFERGLEQVRALGFDEAFIRTWRFYLCYCEGGFLERDISDVQMVFSMRDWRGQAWRAQEHGAILQSIGRDERPE